MDTTPRPEPLIRTVGFPGAHTASHSADEASLPLDLRGRSVAAGANQDNRMRPACETFWGVRVGLKGDDRPSCICAEREPKSSPKATSARVGRLVAPDVPGASGSSPAHGPIPRRFPVPGKSAQPRGGVRAVMNAWIGTRGTRDCLAMQGVSRRYPARARGCVALAWVGSENTSQTA